MRSFVKTAIFLMLAAAGLIRPVYAEVKVGETAPDFSLENLEGQKESLVSHQGKFVVLEWVNPDCPFVKKHYDTGNMQQLQKEYTQKGVDWLSIDSSAPGKQGYYSTQEWKQILVDRGAMPTSVLLDPKGMAGHLYGAQTTPHMFVIDPKGILVYQGAIDDIASADATDVEKATNYVRQALDEAMSGKPVSVSTTKSYGCSVKY